MRKVWMILFVCLTLVACNRISNPLQAPPPPQVTVTLIADGERRSVSTSAATVDEVLEEAQIHLGGLDRVEPGEYLALEEGMTITVIRVIEQFLTTESSVPYEQQLVRNEGLPEGDRRLLQAGQVGVEQVVYRIEYHDGVEVERRMIKREVMQPALDEIVMIGVKGAVTPVSIPGTLAYISGGNGVIMRTSSAHRDAVVTSGDLDGRVFSLSPDGRRLLFTRSIAYTGSITGSLPAFNSLWVVTTTRLSAPLRPESLGVDSVLWANWSPDGDQIAYSTAQPINQPPGWEANNDLWIGEWYMSGRFRSEQLIEPSSGGIYGWWGGQYAWSPNGRFIAYGHADEVGIIDVATASQESLHHFNVYHTYSDWVWTPTLTWSPDSRFVAAIVHGPPIGSEQPEDSPIFDLWVWDMDEWVSVPLAERVGMWGMPSWSPARQVGVEMTSQLAFLKAGDPLESATTRYSLWTMDRDGSDSVSHFPPVGEMGLRPQPVAWSPEGSQIALVYGGDLYLVSTAPGAASNRPLTSDAINSNPVWAPWGDTVSSEVPLPTEDDIPLE